MGPEVPKAHSNIGFDSPSGCGGSLNIGVGGPEVPKRIPTLTLIPPSGCRGSLDIGVGGPEVPKAHPGIGVDPPSGCRGSQYRRWWPSGSQKHSNIDFDSRAPQAVARFPKASNIRLHSPKRLQRESGFRSWWPRGSQKRVPTLALIPPSGCKGSLDIGAGGPEVLKAHPDIDLDSPKASGGSIIGGGPSFPKHIPTLTLTPPRVVARGVWISVVGPEVPKSIPTLALIPKR